MNETITILHPGIEATPMVGTVVARPVAAPVLAPRLATLAGKRVALLDNGKVNAGAILAAIAARLQTKFDVAAVRSWKKRHAGDSGVAVIPGLLAWKPDLALTAIGD